MRFRRRADAKRNERHNTRKAPGATYWCRQNCQKGTSGWMTWLSIGDSELELTSVTVGLSSLTTKIRLWAWTNTSPADCQHTTQEYHHCNKKLLRLSCHSTGVVSAMENECYQQAVTVTLCWQHGTRLQQMTDVLMLATNICSTNYCLTLTL